MYAFRAARKFQLHKQPGAKNFWREHDTPLKLAVALVEYTQQLARVRLSRSSSAMPAAARTASQASLSDSEAPRANAAGGGGSNKQNPWTKMAVQQHQLATGGGMRSPLLGTGGAGAGNGRSRSGKADAASDVESTVAARRAGRSLNARFGDYGGDLFGQRGDYASSILYLSRMPVAGADEVQLTGPLANRRSSAAGSPAAGGSLRRSSVIAQGESAYSSSAGAVLASMQLAQQAQQLAAQGGGGGGAAASLAGGAAPAAGSGAAAVAAARQQHGGGAGTVTFADGKSQAASLARSGAASTVASGIAAAAGGGGSGGDEAGESGDAEFRGVEGEDEEGGPGPRVQLLDAEAIVTALSRGAHASTGFTLQLLHSAATSHGSGAGGLRRLGHDDEEKEGDGAIVPARLSLRQQCALALREMSRDPASRTAIIDQGGFRALLAVLLESEAGAEAEAEALADVVAHKSERAASIYGAGPDEPSRSVWAAKSATGGPGSVRSSQGGGSDPSTPVVIVSQHAGRSLVRRGVGTQTVLLRPEGGYAAAAAGYPTVGSTHIEGCLVDAPIELRFMAGTQAVGGSGGAAADAEGPQSLGDSDEGGSTFPGGGGGGADAPAASASESLSRQPLTDTLFNCLAAICNLSAVPPADVRAAYDVPLPAPAAAEGAAPHGQQLPEPPPPLEPGLVALLVTLSPSVVGAARCLLLTTLFNFSTHRPHRERLIEEGGVAGVLALMAPELQHMRGNAPVRVSDEEATAFAQQAAQRGGTGLQRGGSFRSSTQGGGAASSLYAEPMDVFGTAVAAASVAAGSGATAAAAPGAVPRWTGAGRGDSQTPSRVAKPRSRGGARTTAVLIPQGVEPSPPVAAAAAAEDEYAEEEWDDDLGSPSKGSAAAVPQPMGPGGRSYLDGEAGKVDDADADADEGDGASAGGGSSDDEDADLLAAVNDLHSRGGGRQWAGSTAGGNVRRRMQLLLRRLQRSQTAGQRRTSQVDLSMLAAAASATPAGEGSAQQRWGVPADSAADASLLLEDAYCLQVGVKLLCNLAGCPAGIDSMLELSSIQVSMGGDVLLAPYASPRSLSYLPPPLRQTLGTLWNWMSPAQHCLVAAHVVYNATRTRVQAKSAAEQGAVLMLSSVVDGVLRVTASQPVISATHDFVLRRSLLALCRLTLNPNAAEYLMWADGCARIAAAMLAIGTQVWQPAGWLCRAGRDRSRSPLFPFPPCSASFPMPTSLRRSRPLRGQAAAGRLLRQATAPPSSHSSLCTTRRAPTWARASAPTRSRRRPRARGRPTSSRRRPSLSALGASESRATRRP